MSAFRCGRVTRPAAFFALCLGPQTLAAADVELLITDRDNDAVYRFDGETGDFIDVFIPGGSGGLDRPVAITIGPDDNLYISNFGPGEILEFDGETGAFLGAFYDDTSELEEPVDVVFDGEYAYLLGNDTENVVVVDAETGNFIREVGVNIIRYPHDMELGADGYLYIATENNNQGLIQVWDMRTDTMVEHFAPPGPLGLATGITFMPGGDVLVSDWWDSEVARYDGGTHDFIDFFIPAESGGISGPGRLVYGPGGDLYVGNGNGVHRFDGETGAFIEVLVATGEGGLDNPRGFVFRTTGTPGDLDGDGDVDTADLLLLLADWGCAGDDCLGDVDGDVDVDTADLLLLLANWG
ncbi:MAG: hypothetical protein SYC29_11945 [Planctomycetota bacterium]|nr:hypothetical protein [Planctomycetota bacterium]